MAEIDDLLRHAMAMAGPPLQKISVVATSMELVAGDLFKKPS